MEKIDSSDFGQGLVVVARQAGLSISQTCCLLGYSHRTISRVYREWSQKYKISSEWKLRGEKGLVDVRVQMSDWAD